MQIIAVILLFASAIFYYCAWRCSRRIKLDDKEIETEMSVSLYDLPTTPEGETCGIFVGLSVIALMLGVLFLFI